MNEFAWVMLVLLLIGLGSIAAWVVAPPLLAWLL